MHVQDDFRENLLEQQYERSDKSPTKQPLPKDEIDELARDDVNNVSSLTGL